MNSETHHNEQTEEDLDKKWTKVKNDRPNCVKSDLYLQIRATSQAKLVQLDYTMVTDRPSKVNAINSKLGQRKSELDELIATRRQDIINNLKAKPALISELHRRQPIWEENDITARILEQRRVRSEKGDITAHHIIGKDRFKDLWLHLRANWDSYYLTATEVGSEIATYNASFKQVYNFREAEKLLTADVFIKRVVWNQGNLVSGPANADRIGDPESSDESILSNLAHARPEAIRTEEDRRQFFLLNNALKWLENEPQDCKSIAWFLKIWTKVLQRGFFIGVFVNFVSQGRECAIAEAQQEYYPGRLVPLTDIGCADGKNVKALLKPGTNSLHRITNTGKENAVYYLIGVKGSNCRGEDLDKKLYQAFLEFHPNHIRYVITRGVMERLGFYNKSVVLRSNQGAFRDEFI